MTRRGHALDAGQELVGHGSDQVCETAGVLARERHGDTWWMETRKNDDGEEDAMLRSRCRRAGEYCRLKRQCGPEEKKREEGKVDRSKVDVLGNIVCWWIG